MPHMGLARFLKRFAAAQDGNVLMITAFTLVFLIGISGAGIDLGRQQLMSNKLQQASDAGALAAAFAPNNSTDAQRQGIALRYYNLNMPTSFLGVSRPTPAISIGSDITVNATANVGTIFVRAVGNSTTPTKGATKVSDTITATGPDYDVVMVVDESGSTSESAPGGGGSRMDVEKNALVKMIDTIFPDDTPNLDLRFGLVGYTGHISSIGALSSNKTMAKSYIAQLRSRCQNFDHYGLEAGGNMLLGNWTNYKAPKTACPPWVGNNSQYSVEQNTGVPPAATSRSDGKSLSDVKHLVFLTDGYIMVEPNLCGSSPAPCAKSYEVFNAQCDKLKAAGAIVHTISFVSKSEGDVAALRKCASVDSDGNPRYYYAPDSATLQTILTSVGTTIRNTRLVE